MNHDEGKGGGITTHNVFILTISMNYKDSWWRRGGALPLVASPTLHCRQPTGIVKLEIDSYWQVRHSVLILW